MSEDKQLPTAATLQERITERIRADFVNLIPDEAWQQYVEREIREFTQGSGEGYHRKEAPLLRMIREAIHAHAKQAILDELTKPEWQAKYGPQGEQLAKEAVTAIVRECAQELVVAAYAPVVQSAVDNLRQNIRNALERGEMI